MNLIYRLLTLLVLVAGIALFWRVDHLSTQDGPVHLYMATLDRDIDSPDFDKARYYLQRENKPTPNQLTHFILKNLLRFLSMDQAEKILVSGMVLLLLTGTAFALAPLGGNPLLFVSLAVPLAHSYTLHLGLYNYYFSLGLFLFGAGLWIRWAMERHIKWLLRFCLLFAFSILTHPFATGSLALFAGVATLSGVLRPAGDGEEAISLRELALFALFLVPGAMLMLAFVLSDTGIRAPHTVYQWHIPWIERLHQFFTLGFNQTYTAENMLISAVNLAALLALIIVALVGLRRHGPVHTLVSRSLLAAFLAFLLLYFMAPFRFKDDIFITDRLLPFVYLSLLLWLGSLPLNRFANLALTLLSLGAALVTLNMRDGEYRNFDRVIAHYLQPFEHMEPNHTVLALNISLAESAQKVETVGRPWHPSSFFPTPVQHQSARGAATRKLIDLSTFQLGTNLFWIAYRDAVNPYRSFSKIEFYLTQSELNDFRNRGGEVDYLLIWGSTESMLVNFAQGEALLTLLGKDYDLIKAYDDEYPMRLYRRRKA
ncbi:MAG: hypothetical protein HQL56_04300 [Magnetococcales bacterium]|nr:hypothetical protein [Magnetococcales bacterium]